MENVIPSKLSKYDILVVHIVQCSKCKARDVMQEYSMEESIINFYNRGWRKNNTNADIYCPICSPIFLNP